MSKKLRSATKGGVYVPSVDRDLFTAGITVGDHVDKIEVHGETRSEMVCLRDAILKLIRGEK